MLKMFKAFLKTFIELIICKSFLTILKISTVNINLTVSKHVKGYFKHAERELSCFHRFQSIFKIILMIQNKMNFK